MVYNFQSRKFRENDQKTRKLMAAKVSAPKVKINKKRYNCQYENNSPFATMLSKSIKKSEMKADGNLDFIIIHTLRYFADRLKYRLLSWIYSLLFPPTCCLSLWQPTL